MGCLLENLQLIHENYIEKLLGICVEVPINFGGYPKIGLEGKNPVKMLSGVIISWILTAPQIIPCDFPHAAYSQYLQWISMRCPEIIIDISKTDGKLPYGKVPWIFGMDRVYSGRSIYWKGGQIPVVFPTFELSRFILYKIFPFFPMS